MKIELRYIAFTLGVLAILLAIFARLIGIDHDVVWGLGRWLILWVGLILACSALFTQMLRMGIIPAKTVRAWRESLGKAANLFGSAIQSTIPACCLAVILLAAISAFIFWYLSVGQFPSFPKAEQLYLYQGEAFARGQISLLQQPSPQLLALKNPYDYTERAAVPFLWDASLYKGKYYIYWGPVPALFYAGAEVLTGINPPGQLMLLIAAVGQACLLAAMLWQIWRRFYPNAPGISVSLFLLAGCINLPNIFLLGKTQTYEISVISGQFFLLLGLFSWWRYLTTRRQSWLVLAGFGWGLAAGSRISLLVSIGVYLCFGLFHFWQQKGPGHPLWKPLVALFSPLGLCLLALGVYNFIRFDNPLETGIRYQLTVPIEQNRYFSANFIPSNLYVYLFYPLHLSNTFPFYQSNLFNPSFLPGWASIPPGKTFDEVFFGIIPTLPILWMIALWVVVLALRRKEAPNSTEPAGTKPGFIGMIALAGGLQFAFMMFYYVSAMRFISDFYLPFFLTAVFSIYQMDGLLRRGHSRVITSLRGILWLCAAWFVVRTALAGYLGSFDIPPQMFRAFNPSLFQTLADHWNQWIKEMRLTPGYLGDVRRLGLWLAGIY